MEQDGGDDALQVQVSSVVMAQIGGASMNSWNLSTHGHATELDSHANMPVAGSGTTVISTTGRHATVTPFSATLPVMEKVEIVDVAMAFDDPISTQTYILIMRNALHIPSMGHNLLPPFMLREAGLQVDETPKFQLGGRATIDNHCIHDPETNLRIHLQLNGIFSYFTTRPLTVEEQFHWESYPVVFLTPDGAMWDPHSAHYEEEEAGMLTADGEIMQRVPLPTQHLLTEADLSELYGDENPISWDAFEDCVDECLGTDDDDESLIGELTDADIDLFREELRGVKVAYLDARDDAGFFSRQVHAKAKASHIAMALGSVTCGTRECELFVDGDSDVAASVSGVTAGKPGGVSAERLATVLSISHNDAARTLSVTTQLNRQSADSSLSRNFGTTDRRQRYQRLNCTAFRDSESQEYSGKYLLPGVCHRQVVLGDIPDERYEELLQCTENVHKGGWCTGCACL